ncbi:unnamed protein product [Chondrus crispus]|uniref:Uncharacterized protein n=1 Tax=Chondrus crispus TaxID=2769 RepID=R7Q545_CHOCR|nr:unnamed protein product [Chondrus crispus]XP_005718450.1 unnamed protein product [Chondrus crispus]CDF32575.1 unnamed protein product [Chondrus crispus]CDF38557.1 unnamed protein product [Chondrus crispus]|eukprot:XP_005712240.1 unnamed protein product [Chondrus crispus]
MSIEIPTGATKSSNFWCRSKNRNQISRIWFGWSLFDYP